MSIMPELFSLEWMLDHLDRFPNNQRYSKGHGKNALFIGSSPIEDGTLSDSLLTQALNDLRLLDASCTVADFVQKVAQMPAKHFGFIFCHSDYLPLADANNYLQPILAHMRNLLSPDGAIFLVVDWPKGQTEWDVSNSLFFSEKGWRPNTSHLMTQDLQEWAIRRMWSVPTKNSSSYVILRLTPKQPSVLLICGSSMSGKTTLAREFNRLSPGAHVSNDFIYTELVRVALSGGSETLDRELVNALGDGTGESCGKFNRALEVDSSLLASYIPHLLASIPTGYPLVTIDFDIRKKSTIDVVKARLQEAGFSVWAVTR